MDFLSSASGVALTADAIPCQVPGVGGLQQAQVRLAVTADGGKQWVARGGSLPSSTRRLADEQVVAASPAVVWALDDTGSVHFTADGGTSWTRQALPAPVERMVDVGRWVWALICPSSSYASPRCDQAEIERAPLTGGAWQAMAALPARSSVVAPSVDVVSSDEVVLVFSPDSKASSALVVTTDGGRSWTAQAPPAGPGNLCRTYPDFSADGPGDWWILCVGSAAAGSSTKALMRSADGGGQWATVSSVPSLTTPGPPGSLTAAEPAALVAASPRRLWLAGNNGLTESSDGGITWVDVAGVDAGGSLASFDVVSPDVAWLLAPGTGLWSTVDGTTWHALGAVRPS